MLENILLALKMSIFEARLIFSNLIDCNRFVTMLETRSPYQSITLIGKHSLAYEMYKNKINI